MTTNQPLSIFISSKMTKELADERRAIKEALAEYRMYGWLWEDDAGARPEPIDSTYLTEVESCDIYIGLFWLSYGLYTIEEFEHARKHEKPCLVYEKHVDIAKRDPKLQAFLDGLQRVKNPEGLTVCWFEKTEQLAEKVQKDVMHLLTSVFRESRQQPFNSLATQASTPGATISISATNGGMAFYNNSGNITQTNIRSDKKQDKQ
jgi:Domain of unknown function (DUF4062)